MGYLGSAILLLAVFSVYFALTENHYISAFAASWLIPILGMFISYHEGIAINGLIAVIGILMFSISSWGVSGVIFWNSKNRRIKKRVMAPVYIITAMLCTYCYYQAFYNGYLPLVKSGVPEWVFSYGLPLALSVPLSLLLYNFIDRRFSKKMGLTLIQCSIFSNNGLGPLEAHFVRGVSNGRIYYFKITKRTFIIINKETALKLQLIQGRLGGLYVTELPVPEKERKALRRDKRVFWLGVGLFAATCAGAYWLFLK